MSSKRIFRNILGFGSIDLVSLMIPIITMPILTRTIGLEGYGIYLLYSTALVFGHTIVDYTSNVNGIRDITTKSRCDKIVFKDYQSTRLVLMMLYCIIISVVFYLTKVEYFLVLSANTFIYLFAYWLLPTWYLVANGKVFFYSKVILFSKFILLFSILIFIKDKNDLWILMLSTSVPFFIASNFIVVYLRHKGLLPKFYFTINRIFITLKSGVDSFVGIFSPNLYNNIPILILGSAISPATFTIFAIASRLCSVCLMLQNTFAKSLYPILSAGQNDRMLKKVIFINLTFSLLSIITIYLFGNWLLLFFLGSGYEGVYTFLLILLPGLIFTGLNFSLTHAYFLPRGEDFVFRNVSLIVSVICSLFGLFLINYMSALGVAILITSARFLLFVGYTLMYIKNESNYKRLNFK